MSKTVRWIALLLVLMSLSSLACGLSGGDEEAPEASTPVATAESAAVMEATSASSPASPEASATVPAPRPTAETELGGSSPALADITNRLQDLDSYRANISLSYEGVDDAGNDTSGSMSLEALFAKDPPASSLIVDMVGLEDAPEGQMLQIVQLDDSVYTAMGGFGCFAGSSTEVGAIAEPFEDLLNPQDQFLTDLKNVDAVGVQTHNGYRSDCYAFDEDDIADEMGELETVTGLVCVSQEFGHVSYMLVEGSGPSAAGLFGNNTFVGTGSMRLEYNIMDINQPVEITIPAECENTGANSVWPVLEDAVELSQFQGLVSYRTTMDFDAILEFYDAEMGNLGFSLDGEPLVMAGSTAILSYSDGSQTVALTVTEAGGSEGFQVLIAPEQ